MFLKKKLLLPVFFLDETFVLVRVNFCNCFCVFVQTFFSRMVGVLSLALQCS